MHPEGIPPPAVQCLQFQLKKMWWQLLNSRREEEMFSVFSDRESCKWFIYDSSDGCPAGSDCVNRVLNHSKKKEKKKPSKCWLRDAADINRRKEKKKFAVDWESMFYESLFLLKWKAATFRATVSVGLSARCGRRQLAGPVMQQQHVIHASTSCRCTMM